jgi:type I restriction enzyme S subunit
VKRLKYSATINDEALAETTDPGYEFKYVDISSVDAVNGIVAEEEMIFETAPSRARRVVRDGDTVVSTVRTYLRAIAPIWNPPDNLVVSTGFAVVRPRSVEPAFLSYALRESSFVETVVARSVGVSYPAVNASEVATIPIPLPPPPEQRAIADFLDAETAKLDTLVAKKRELIEKLKEKRTALISRTVTRSLPPEAARAAGLNPHPKLKPSGIEWLGEIPEHWETPPALHAL